MKKIFAFKSKNGVFVISEIIDSLKKMGVVNKSWVIWRQYGNGIERRYENGCRGGWNKKKVVELTLATENKKGCLHWGFVKIFGCRECETVTVYGGGLKKYAGEESSSSASAYSALAERILSLKTEMPNRHAQFLKGLEKK